MDNIVCRGCNKFARNDYYGFCSSACLAEFCKKYNLIHEAIINNHINCQNECQNLKDELCSIESSSSSVVEEENYILERQCADAGMELNRLQKEIEQLKEERKELREEKKELSKAVNDLRDNTERFFLLDIKKDE